MFSGLFEKHGVQFQVFGPKIQVFEKQDGIIGMVFNKKLIAVKDYGVGRDKMEQLLVDAGFFSLFFTLPFSCTILFIT